MYKNFCFVFNILLIIIIINMPQNSYALECGDNNMIIQKPIIFNKQRVALTQKYRAEHYGISDKSIQIQPQMIVVHWTNMPTFKKSFAYFNKPTLAQDRMEIKSGGLLNVSTHFLVDRDGRIYQLMPTTWMARHVIGLNPIAIGIENVGGVNNKDDLTIQQVNANIKLIRLLKQCYPNIQYLIGHLEYLRFQHTPLWQERNPHYHTVKSDPGSHFMAKIRAKLTELRLLSKYTTRSSAS